MIHNKWLIQRVFRVSGHVLYSDIQTFFQLSSFYMNPVTCIWITSLLNSNSIIDFLTDYTSKFSRFFHSIANWWVYLNAEFNFQSRCKTICIFKSHEKDPLPSKSQYSGNDAKVCVFETPKTRVIVNPDVILSAAYIQNSGDTYILQMKFQYRKLAGVYVWVKEEHFMIFQMKLGNILVQTLLLTIDKNDSTE